MASHTELVEAAAKQLNRWRCLPMCGSRQATVEASYRDGDILYQDLTCRYCDTVYTTSKELKKED